MSVCVLYDEICLPGKGGCLRHVSWSVCWGKMDLGKCKEWMGSDFLLLHDRDRESMQERFDIFRRSLQGRCYACLCG